MVLKRDLSLQVPATQAQDEFQPDIGGRLRVEVFRKARSLVADTEHSSLCLHGEGEIDLSLTMLNGITHQFVDKHREARSFTDRQAHILDVKVQMLLTHDTFQQ